MQTEADRNSRGAAQQSGSAYLLAAAIATGFGVLVGTALVSATFCKSVFQDGAGWFERARSAATNRYVIIPSLAAGIAKYFQSSTLPVNRSDAPADSNVPLAAQAPHEWGTGRMQWAEIVRSNEAQKERGRQPD